MVSETLFFIASKLTWLAVRPETLLILVLLVACVASWAGWVRLLWCALFMATLGFLMIGVFPLGQLVMSPLETAFPSRPAVSAPAGIIVLGGGEDTDRAVIWDQALINEAGDRFLAGLELARRFPKAQLVFTGGRAELLGSGPPGARVAERIFAQAGIPPSRLTLERESRNTVENARLTRELVDGVGQGPWVLVTSAFHMPRAVATFCAAGWERIVPWPTDYRSGTFWAGIGWAFAENLQGLNTGLKEWVGLVGYHLLDHTDSLMDQQCVAG